MISSNKKPNSVEYNEVAEADNIGHLEIISSHLHGIHNSTQTILNKVTATNIKIFGDLDSSDSDKLPEYLYDGEISAIKDWITKIENTLGEIDHQVEILQSL